MEQRLILGRHDLPVQWHEAVALVRSVGDAIAEGRLQAVPPLGELTLDRDGVVHAVPGAARVLRRQAGDEIELTRALRQLLGQLLDAAAPVELRALAEEEDSSSSSGGLAEFTRALGFFERPSKERDLRGLAARLREVQEERELEAEMERLTQKTRSDEPPQAGQANTPPAARKHSPNRVVLTTLGLVGLLTLIALLLYARGAFSGASSDTGPTGLLARLRSAAHSVVASSAPLKSGMQPVKASSAARRSPVRVRPAVGPPDSPRPKRQPSRGEEIDRATEPEVTEVPVSGAPGVEPLTGLPRYSTIIYDQRNADVIPATLLRPHLPTISSPGVPKGRLGKLEVLVGEDGRVERVHLVATTVERRYYDAMILAAVKAWIFRPASRGGQPVRYRVQIPLT
jgi:hypothetical protein